jgi:hypothetical protein
MATKTNHEGFLARHVPCLGWLRGYRWGQWFTLDVIAGVSVGALLIPESMGMAGVAGLPPEVGLYAAPLAMLGYAIFGRSTVLVVASSASTAAAAVRRPPLDVPGRPRASPGCTARATTDWSAISPFTRIVSGSVSVVLAATTVVNDRYKPGWSASLQCSGGWMFHLIGVMLAPG